MATIPATSNHNADNADTNAPAIPLYDRFVLWMFLVGFVLFGLILLGDLFSGFVR